MTSAEQVESISFMEGKLMAQWPVVENATIGYALGITSEGDMDSKKLVFLQLTHAPIGEPEKTTTETFGLQPDVLTQLLISLAHMHTDSEEEADMLLTLWGLAKKYFIRKEGDGDDEA